MKAKLNKILYSVRTGQVINRDLIVLGIVNNASLDNVYVNNKLFHNDIDFRFSYYHNYENVIYYFEKPRLLRKGDIIIGSALYLATHEKSIEHSDRVKLLVFNNTLKKNTTSSLEINYIIGTKFKVNKIVLPYNFIDSRYKNVLIYALYVIGDNINQNVLEYDYGYSPYNYSEFPIEIRNDKLIGYHTLKATLFYKNANTGSFDDLNYPILFEIEELEV